MKLAASVIPVTHPSKNTQVHIWHVSHLLESLLQFNVVS